MNSFINFGNAVANNSNYNNNRQELNMKMSSVNGTFTINGVKMNCNNCTISNGQVFIDNQPLALEKGTPIYISVVGPVDSIEAAVVNNLSVTGNCNKISIQSGNVTCQSVSGSVQTQTGNINVSENINGNASSMSGNIGVGGKITGNCSTMSGRQ